MKNEVKLGELITGEACKDAVHIAVAPVVAAQNLVRGQHVGFVDASASRVGPSEHPIGIVDPFLAEAVPTGAWCYVFLYPNTITSLRHAWTHPAFHTAEERAESEEWMGAFAYLCDMSVAEVLSAARRYRDEGIYYVSGDESSRDAMFAAGPKVFWHHFEVMTGEPGDPEQEAFFSFAC